MKALDTPVLLDLLRGSPDARQLVRTFGNEEVATTELNLWELGELAVEDRAPGVERRIATIDRLRRKLLVFPVDAASVQAAVRVASREGTPHALRLSQLIRGTLESHGCTEWISVREVAPKKGAGALKFVEYPKCVRKHRK